MGSGSRSGCSSIEHVKVRFTRLWREHLGLDFWIHEVCSREVEPAASVTLVIVEEGVKVKVIQYIIGCKWVGKVKAKLLEHVQG